jgi:hypothetical protein
MKLQWASFKTLLSQNPVLALRSVKGESFYSLTACDQSDIVARCEINHQIELEDTEDFESNYLPLANAFKVGVEIAAMPAFANKKLNVNGVQKSLFKRVVGISQAVTQGETEFSWTQSMYPWAKFLGIEVIGGETGDSCSLFVLDTAEGTYSGVPNYPLNQFGFSVNISKDFYKRIAEYDADIYQGLQLKFVYNSVSDKNVYMNFDLNEVRT